MKPNWHYYESHITLEPVFEQRLEQLKVLCSSKEFRVADLLMKKTAEEEGKPSYLDTFTTGRSDRLQELVDRTASLVTLLRRAGYAVTRYKIESTVIDSRYEDKLELL